MDKLFGMDVLDIAYSTLNGAPINTAEHLRYASDCGFQILKGDLQLTSDGGLVMCHDNGLTLNNEGRITKFDRAHYLDFSTLSFSACVGYEHEAYHEKLGHYAKFISLEDFIRFCKANGKLAYLTARERFIPQVVSEIFRILRLYDMENAAIINSFTYETLSEVRKYSDTVPVSNVQPYGAVLTTDTVRRIQALGNSIVTMFSFSHSPTSGFPTVEASAEALGFARENGVATHMAIVTKQEDYARLVAGGFTGIQLEAVFPPYVRPADDGIGK